MKVKIVGYILTYEIEESDKPQQIILGVDAGTKFNMINYCITYVKQNGETLKSIQIQSMKGFEI